MDIVLCHPSEFPNIFPMMGTFHMAKVSLHCADKYSKGSGIDTALIFGRMFWKEHTCNKKHRTVSKVVKDVVVA